MINKWKYLLMASMVCALALAAGSLAIADDDEWLAFEGTIDGQFVDGPDPRPRIFTARTTAVGDSTLGPLSLATFVFQDASEVPPDCLPGSSIGAGGRASIVLADSSMQLERELGDACFAFPNITVTEIFRVVSGTGLFEGAIGDVTLYYVGDVTDGTISGALFGVIEFDDDDDDDEDDD